MYKQILAATAIVMTLVMFLPYIRSIRSGQVRPHLFSWLVWAIATLIVFLAQLAGDGGVGAWPMGISGAITAYIAFLAYRRLSAHSISRMDWVFLIIALSALPFWFLTSDPLSAVIILTGVDLAGFAPTFRASYARPFEESLAFYLWAAIRNGVSILALEHTSTTTVLFPAATGAACFIFVAMVAYRRTLTPHLGEGPTQPRLL